MPTMTKKQERDLVAVVKAIQRERYMVKAAEDKVTEARSSADRAHEVLESARQRAKALRQRLDEIIEGRYWDANNCCIVEGYRD